MSTKQFKCPRCGNDERFWTDSVILYNAHVYIDNDGWDYMSEGGDVDLADSSQLTCEVCGYSAYAGWFQE